VFEDAQVVDTGETAQHSVQALHGHAVGGGEHLALTLDERQAVVDESVERVCKALLLNRAINITVDSSLSTLVTNILLRIIRIPNIPLPQFFF